MVAGPHEQRDIYSIVTDVDPVGITAVRLDALTRERLPNSGPGRHSSGNFHLAEIILEISDETNSKGVRGLKFDRVWATHSWRTRLIKNAVDRNAETVWHVWGSLKMPHTAIFYLRNPIPSSNAKTFTIRLVHGGENFAATLGRFRLSIQRAMSSDDDNPPTDAAGPKSGK